MIGHHTLLIDNVDMRGVIFQLYTCRLSACLRKDAHSRSHQRMSALFCGVPTIALLVPRNLLVYKDGRILSSLEWS